MPRWNRERGIVERVDREDWDESVDTDGRHWLLWGLTTAGAKLVACDNGEEKTVSPRTWYGFTRL